MSFYLKDPQKYKEQDFAYVKDEIDNVSYSLTKAEMLANLFTHSNNVVYNDRFDGLAAIDVVTKRITFNKQNIIQVLAQAFPFIVCNIEHFPSLIAIDEYYSNRKCFNFEEYFSMFACYLVLHEVGHYLYSSAPSVVREKSKGVCASMHIPYSFTYFVNNVVEDSFIQRRLQLDYPVKAYRDVFFLGTTIIQGPFSVINFVQGLKAGNPLPIREKLFYLILRAYNPYDKDVQSMFNNNPLIEWTPEVLALFDKGISILDKELRCEFTCNELVPALFNILHEVVKIKQDELRNCVQDHSSLLDQDKLREAELDEPQDGEQDNDSEDTDDEDEYTEDDASQSSSGNPDSDKPESDDGEEKDCSGESDSDNSADGDDLDDLDDADDDEDLDDESGETDDVEQDEDYERSWGSDDDEDEDDSEDDSEDTDDEVDEDEDEDDDIDDSDSSEDSDVDDDVDESDGGSSDSDSDDEEDDTDSSSSNGDGESDIDDDESDSESNEDSNGKTPDGKSIEEAAQELEDNFAKELEDASNELNSTLDEKNEREYSDDFVDSLENFAQNVDSNDIVNAVNEIRKTSQKNNKFMSGLNDYRLRSSSFDNDAQRLFNTASSLFKRIYTFDTDDLSYLDSGELDEDLITDFYTEKSINIFKQHRDLVESKKIRVVFMVDDSGSMSGMRSSNCRTVVPALIHSFEESGIQCAFYMFGSSCGLVKDFDDPAVLVNNSVSNILYQMDNTSVGGSTNITPALLSLASRDYEDKDDVVYVLFVLTDGCFDNEETASHVFEYLRTECGFSLFGITIDDRDGRRRLKRDMYQNSPEADEFVFDYTTDELITKLPQDIYNTIVDRFIKKK